MVTICFNRYLAVVFMKIDKLIDQFDCYTLCKKLGLDISIDTIEDRVMISGYHHYFLKVNTKRFASIFLTLKEYEEIICSEQQFLKMIEE